MKKKAAFVIQNLEALYPESECMLNWEGDPFRLFVMAVLSAQTTDEQVNKVAARLFEAFPDAQTMASSAEGELEALIKSVGLYNTKSRNLRKASKMICERFGGKIPSDMEALLSLPGVGRKVANLIRGDVFDLGGIVADTHCIRISYRLGFVDSKNPLTVERVLESLIPKEKQSAFCHRIVRFGRDICSAKKAFCRNCPLEEICEKKFI